jgi:hypothetical protein
MDIKQIVAKNIKEIFIALFLGGIAILITWQFGLIAQISFFALTTQTPFCETIVGETNLLHKLKRDGDWIGLANELDRCIAIVPEGDFIRGSQSGNWDEQPEQKVS